MTTRAPIRIVAFAATLAASSLLAAQSLSPWDQAVVDTAANGEARGAIIETEIGCALLPGFANADGLVAFGGLFPNAPDSCAGGTFERLNPDGSVDLHLRGHGGFFLLVFSPTFSIYSSEGSDVRWNVLQQENGIRILTINGWLSDGSRVRAHFTASPGDEDHARGDFLWVEGIGYVVGRF